MNYLNKIEVEAKKRNIPLKQLADSIDITEKVFRKALKNNTLSLSQLHTVCAELHIDVSDIFDLDKTIEIKYSKDLNFLGSKIFC